jgi:hypothetical protein
MFILNILNKIKNYIRLYPLRYNNFNLIMAYIRLYTVKYNPYKQYAVTGSRYLSDGVWMREEIDTFDTLLDCYKLDMFSTYDYEEYKDFEVRWSEEDLSKILTRNTPDKFYAYVYKIERQDINTNLKKLERKGHFKESFMSKGQHKLIDDAYWEITEFFDKLCDEDYWTNDNFKEEYRHLQYCADTLHVYYERTKQ